MAAVFPGGFKMEVECSIDFFFVFVFFWGGSILFVFIYSVFSYLWGRAELKKCEGRGTKKGDGRFLVGGKGRLRITSTFLFIDSVHVHRGPGRKCLSPALCTSRLCRPKVCV